MSNLHLIDRSPFDPTKNDIRHRQRRRGICRKLHVYVSIYKYMGIDEYFIICNLTFAQRENWKTRQLLMSRGSDLSAAEEQPKTDTSRVFLLRSL